MSVASNARLQGESGTFVLPAHSPYERQLLREHLRRGSGRPSTLTLGTDGMRWTLTRHNPSDALCAACQRSLGRLSCSRAGMVGATCIDCALQPDSNATTTKESSYE